MAPEIPQDHAVWGNCLGKGAARCFRILGEQVDGDLQLQVRPVASNFICPLSLAKPKKPVFTVDGYLYDKDYILNWFNKFLFF